MLYIRFFLHQQHPDRVYAIIQYLLCIAPYYIRCKPTANSIYCMPSNSILSGCNISEGKISYYFPNNQNILQQFNTYQYFKAKSDMLISLHVAYYTKTHNTTAYIRIQQRQRTALLHITCIKNKVIIICLPPYKKQNDSLHTRKHDIRQRKNG